MKGHGIVDTTTPTTIRYESNYTYPKMAYNNENLQDEEYETRREHIPHDAHTQKPKLQSLSERGVHDAILDGQRKPQVAAQTGRQTRLCILTKPP